MDVWANLKRMASDGELEIEMSQAVAGIKGTTFICEEKDGVSTVKVFEGTVEVTANATGKSAMVSGGEMFSTDSAGKGTLTMFDMEAELDGWDSHAQQVTAEAMDEPLRKRSGFPLLFAAVLAILLAGGVAAAVFIAVRNKRNKTAFPAHGTSVQQKQIHEVKFCPNCGSQLNRDSRFCGKCGRSLL